MTLVRVVAAASKDALAVRDGETGDELPVWSTSRRLKDAEVFVEAADCGVSDGQICFSPAVDTT